MDVRHLLPLSSVKIAHGPEHSAERYLGVEILTDEFESEGILFQDEGLLLKAAYARLCPGDLICLFRAGQILIHRYDPHFHKDHEIIGKITRTWRDYK